MENIEPVMLWIILKEKEKEKKKRQEYIHNCTGQRGYIKHWRKYRNNCKQRGMGMGWEDYDLCRGMIWYENYNTTSCVRPIAKCKFKAQV